MYLEEFMEKFMLLFPDNFKNERNCDEWQRQYIRVLRPSNFSVDYKKLWEKIMDEWKSDKTPSPAWLKEVLCQCKKNLSMGETKTVEIKYPWIENMTYITEIPVNWDIADVIKQNMPKNGWKWCEEKRTAIRIVQ